MTNHSADDITLTESQKAALNEFEQFLDSEEEQVFVLNGAAGTGKTTLLKLMVDMTLANRGAESHISLMAPTGRAAMILSSKTGREARTIHSTIYGLEGEEYATETPKRRRKVGKENADPVGIKLLFGLRGAGGMFPRKVNFVDEASMISNTYSDNEVFKFGTGYLLNDLMNSITGQKVVFVGDMAQLPPVGMENSPALDVKYLEGTYGLKCKEVTLTEVIRQAAESTILVNATRLRHYLDNSMFHRFKLKDGKDVTKTADIVDTYMSEADSLGLANAIIISHTNAKANSYNQEVRGRLWGENAPRLVAGDYLIVSRNNFSAGGEVYNGTIVKVERCEGDENVETRVVSVPKSRNKRQSDGSKGNKKPYDELKEDPSYVNVTLKFRNVTVGIPVGGDERMQNRSYLLLDNFLDDDNPQITKDLASALFLDFRRRNPNLKPKTKEFTKALLKDKYFNALVCKYGYAITCHKAQGGEWRTVVADMEWRGGKATRDMFRWAYTVITRASGKLFHAYEPDYNYLTDIFVATPEFVEPIKLVGEGGERELSRSGCQQFQLLEPLIRHIVGRESMSIVGKSHSDGHDDYLVDCKGALVRFTFNYGNKKIRYVSVVTKIAKVKGNKMEILAGVDAMLDEFRQK